jgi:hypothetical protein
MSLSLINSPSIIWQLLTISWNVFYPIDGTPLDGLMPA